MVFRGRLPRPSVTRRAYWRYLTGDVARWLAARGAALRALPAERRRRVLTGSLLVVLAAGLVGGGAAPPRPGAAHVPPGSQARSKPSTPPPPPPVLAADRATGTGPAAAAVAAALADPLADPGLGGRVAARVVDLGTGTVLFDRGGDRLATPASTTKITTTVAALGVLPPDHRFTTTVVSGDKPGQVVLVGGGDPTLSAAKPGHDPAYPGAARLSDLASQVAAWAAKSGTTVTQVVVDASLFTGPAVHPTWEPSDVPGGFVAPIEALMLDGGRRRPGFTARSTHPAADAGQAFAALLGLPPSAVVDGTAPAHGQVVARVRSAPMLRIIDQMLAVSDNVLAECLARQVALATGRPGSFDGAADAVRHELSALGVDITGEQLLDGSGLSPQDRLSPALLVNVLRVAASRAHPALHALFPGLPVAGYDGTLADRYQSGTAAGYAGMVRAKTGTLTGVSTLSGVAQDTTGRSLAFAFMADRVAPGGTLAAEAALDRLAATLAGCGCR